MSIVLGRLLILLLNYHNFKNLLSVSCLEMVNCHNFSHFCAVSLKLLKSSREQGVLSSGHCSRCSIVCVSVSQVHEGSPV